MAGLKFAPSTALIFTALITASFSTSAFAQMREEQTVQKSLSVLNEMMANSATGIPQSMLDGAHGVAVIPNVIKGSFVFGARHGRGLLCARDASGAWHAPVFISLTGGNVGWQIGVNSSDIVLVFKTARSLDGILSGKLTLGADIAAAAGPLGGQASAATDGRLQAEIYSYARTRGLFAGVAIDGSVVKIDHLATGAYYQNSAPGQTAVIPASAQLMAESIATYTVTAIAAPAPAGPPNTLAPAANPTANPIATGNGPSPEFVQRYSASETDLLRRQISQISPAFFDLLDSQWQAHLSLPSSLFGEGAHPTAADLQPVMDRYRAIATDPQYARLAARPEFQSVYGLLQHYQQSLQPTAGTLQLPPPPALQ